ncbi:ZNF540 isoform 7, partial [Pongo abelii]
MAHVCYPGIRPRNYLQKRTFMISVYPKGVK